jgi:hypothetical protein
METSFDDRSVPSDMALPKLFTLIDIVKGCRTPALRSA